MSFQRSSKEKKMSPNLSESDVWIALVEKISSKQWYVCVGD